MSFYKGKRVLITGATGFIGSHLTERLLKEGADVSIFEKADDENGARQRLIAGLAGNESKFIQIIKGDIGDEKSVQQIAENNPDIIFHLAAIAFVDYSFKHPAEVLKANLQGTINVLDAGKACNAERIVCTSSSEVYGCTLKDSGIDEEHVMNPQHPYGASKVAADRYCFAYHRSFGTPVTIIRIFNTYGPRHTYDMPPKFISLALRNEPITIYGGGEQSRDLLYVSDTVEAFMLMGQVPGIEGEAINIGTGMSWSVNHIAKLIQEFSNSLSEIIHVEKRMGEVKCLKANNSKAKRLLGWEPKVSIEDGLRKNIEWMRGVLK